MMNFLKDWIIQYQNKFSVGGVETTIERVTGTVSQEGDTISAAYLNEIQKNCIYQVNATRVVDGVLEIYDITIDGSEEFTPFNQTFWIDFSATNTKVDSLLRFNGITYSLRFSDSITNGDIAPKIGFLPKRALVKLDVTNSKAIVVDFNPNNFVSPAFSGIPTAPTGTAGVSSDQIATQENVLNNIASNKQTAKAWVNFNGVGTVAIRSSYNVSSITDNGVGDYTVNFTNAMADTNYILQATGCPNSIGAEGDITIQSPKSVPSTTAIRVQNGVPGTAYNTPLTPMDSTYIHVLIFGN